MINQLTNVNNVIPYVKVVQTHLIIAKLANMEFKSIIIAVLAKVMNILIIMITNVNNVILNVKHV